MWKPAKASCIWSVIVIEEPGGSFGLMNLTKAYNKDTKTAWPELVPKDSVISLRSQQVAIVVF